MHKLKRKLLSTLLTLAMLVSLVPAGSVPAMAEESSATAEIPADAVCSLTKGDNTTYYSSFVDAIMSAGDSGSTITVLKDIKEHVSSEQMYRYMGNLTINAEGHTVNLGPLELRAMRDVTINGGTWEDVFLTAVEGADLIIRDATCSMVESFSSSSDVYLIDGTIDTLICLEASTNYVAGGTIYDIEGKCTTYYYPTDLSFSFSEKPDVLIGKTVQIFIKPNVGELGEITWSSDDPEIATVDENGVVTGVAAGQTNIRATATIKDLPEKLKDQGLSDTLQERVLVTIVDKQLDGPATVAWDPETLGKVSWDVVTYTDENSIVDVIEAAYEVWLYKDNEDEFYDRESIYTGNNPIPEDGKQSYTFTLTEGGTYTAKVRAVGKSSTNIASSEFKSSDALEIAAVTFKSDEPAYNETQFVRVGEKLTEPDALEKEGYDFAGWQDESGKVWDFDEPATTVGNFTLTPKWTPWQTYDVTIADAEGGSATATPTSGWADATIQLAATPEEGYHFVEWQTTPEDLAISDDNTFKMPAEAVTITPVFAEHTVDEWSSNKDGSHSGVCTFCDETVTEACSYGEDNVCDVCDYERITITEQPESQSVEEGEKVTFSVKATGSSITSYQWQQSADNGQNWTDIPSVGAKSASYSFYAYSGVDGYQYRCVVSNSGDRAESAAATLTVSGEELTQEPVEYIDHEADGTELPGQLCKKYAVIDGSDTTLGDDEAAKVTNEDGSVEYWYVAEGTIQGQNIVASGDVHIILKDGCSWTIPWHLNMDGTPTCNLTIYGQSEGDNMGLLKVGPSGPRDKYYTDLPDGISGNHCGDITINGGHIISVCEWQYQHGAAIGAGNYGGVGGGHCGNIAINGGHVEATAGVGAAGIGSGVPNGWCGDITITGGIVSAYGSTSHSMWPGGAGIGHGSWDEGSVSGAFSTGANGDAVIFAQSQNSDAISNVNSRDDWHGVIFENDTGHVYGLEKMPRSFTIPEGKTLIIDEGQTVTIPADIEIEVNGAIEVRGTLVNEGTLSGSGELRVNAGGELSGDGSIADTLEKITPVTAVTLEPEKIELAVGESEQLKATVRPDDATDTALTWTSSNTGVASVDENGKVTAQAPGTATITVQSQDDPAITDTCEVTVTGKAVESVTLDKTRLDLEPGDTAQLTATITPEDATDKTLTWTSDDENAATVDQNGKVTAGEEGYATITVTTSNGKTATCDVYVGTKPVTPSTIKLDQTALSLSEGDTATLTTTVGPEGTSPFVNWSSSDEDVATVEDGVVTAVGAGTATITAASASVPDLTATCEVTVTAKTVAVTSVAIAPQGVALHPDETATLTATVLPENATDKTLTWSSDKENVATVEDGVVTAHAAGTATITAETANGVSGSCTVTVTEETIDVTSITLDPQEVTLEPGKTTTITADVQPETATDRSLTWTSEDEGIATVDDGTITAVAEGSTTITAATANGLTATCEVTVKKAAEETPDPEPGTPSGPIIPSKPSQPDEPSTGVTTGDDNDSTVTTAKPEVSTENGTTSATVTEDMGTTIVEQVKENESASVVIAPEMDSTATNTAVTLPAGTVANIGNDTKADLVITTPVANVTLPNGALAELASAGDAITVSASVEENIIHFNVSADGGKVANVPGGVTLTVPAETAAGTVAVLVREDGTREVVRKSVAGEDSVRIPLDGSATIEIVDNSKDFADVAAGSWYEDAVAFASSHELFNGTSATSFSPDTGMSRGMLATVLCNLERGDGSSLSNGFSDVADDAWYADSIAWAAENGVINGYGDGSVGADDLITREQMAAMLYNYAGMLGIDTSARADLSAYSDGAGVSGWADDVMSWAVAEGLISGMTDDTLAPQGTATRAQVAAMLERFVRNVL